MPFSVAGIMDCVHACIQSVNRYLIVLLLISIVFVSLRWYRKWKGRPMGALVGITVTGLHFVKLIASEVWNGARGGMKTILSRT